MKQFLKTVGKGFLILGMILGLIAFVIFMVFGLPSMLYHLNHGACYAYYAGFAFIWVVIACYFLGSAVKLD